MLFNGLIILAAILALPVHAHAYIDPGSGSYIIQILIGTLLGGIYLVKHFWKTITTSVSNFFRKLQKKKR